MSNPVAQLLLGDLPGFTRDPLGFVEERLIGSDKPARLRFGLRPVIFLGRPSAIRHVLVDHRDRYDKGLEVGRLRPLFGASVLTALEADPRWHDSRALATPAFSPASVERGLELALGVLAEDVGRLAASAGVPVTLHQAMGQVALRMAGAALFHVRLTDAQVETMYRACTVAHRRLSETMWRPVDPDVLLPTPKRRRFHAAIRDIEGVVKAVGQNGKGILDGLRPIVEKYGEQALLNEAVTLLIAGFETTGSLAGWLVYALACRPDLVAWIREEVESVRSLGGDIPPARLREMARTKALVQEMLRLYPSAWWYARTAQVDDVIDGVAVPKGTTVMICPWVVHRQPDIWPDPERLDPTRFLGRQVRDRYAYIPFGAGPRVCIGQHLGTYELMAIAAAVVSAFDLVPEGAPIEQRRPVGGVTLGHPADGLTVRFFVRERRRAAA